MALKNVELYQVDRDISYTNFCARYLAKNSRVKVRIPQELKSPAVLVKPQAQAERVNSFIALPLLPRLIVTVAMTVTNGCTLQKETFKVK